MQETPFQDRGNRENCGNRGNDAEIMRKVPFQKIEIWY